MSEGKQCFIATHNIDFIKGVVEADSSRVKIIKINRSGNTNTFTIIDNESISAIATDRILKYTNILDGLLYGTLALCENEADCRFYAALLESLDPTKYQDTLFCAVGGKHQFKKVIPLLKKLGIQYRAIADIDLISSKDDLKQLLNAIEPGDYEGIEAAHSKFMDAFQEGTNAQVKTQKRVKSEINSIFNDDEYMTSENATRIKELAKGMISRFDLLKKAGRGGLPQGDCVSLFDEVNSYLSSRNIFIVESGEIERFVPDVGNHGNAWLEKVFERHPNMDDSVCDEAKRFIKKVFGIE